MALAGKKIKLFGVESFAEPHDDLVSGLLKLIEGINPLS